MRVFRRLSTLICPHKVTNNHGSLLKFSLDSFRETFTPFAGRLFFRFSYYLLVIQRTIPRIRTFEVK